MSRLSYVMAADGIATITLHNAPQNRIDDAMVDQLNDAIEGIGQSEARAVIVRASGPDFSFGGDITTWPLDDTARLRTMFDRYMSVFNRFERLPMPTIACVNGLCFGGGFELALRADVIFAADDARFGHPEQTIGIITLLGGVQRVAEKAGRAFASEWAMTSEQIGAAVMQAHGVVNRIYPADTLFEEVSAFALKVAGGPTRAYSVHKAILAAWAIGGIASADSALLGLAMPLFDGPDSRLGIESAIKALAEGRPRPAMNFTGR